VNAFCPCIVANHLRVVWVWVADFVRADALHKATVSAPNLRPIDHVVIRGAVDCASFVVDALVCGMNGADYLTEVVLPVGLLFI